MRLFQALLMSLSHLGASAYLFQLNRIEAGMFLAVTGVIWSSLTVNELRRA